MFWCRSSGLPIPQRVETAAEVAGVARALGALGLRRGVLLAVPIPERDAIDPVEIETAIAAAIVSSESAGERGAAVTPRVLAAIATATEGRTVPANLALAEHNAEVAAQVARAFTQP
jgi:pseudouridine-5'-phosphate glycosidase